MVRDAVRAPLDKPCRRRDGRIRRWGNVPPEIGGLTVRRADLAAHLEFDDVMSAETVDQILRRTLGDDLAVIDNGEAVAEAFGLVHVVGVKRTVPPFFWKHE